MPDAVPHLGMLDGDDYPLGVLQDMSILPSTGREADVPSFGFDCLTVSIGYKMACIAFRAILLVADLIAIRIVYFNLHVTPRIDGLPIEAKLSKSYSA